MEKKNTKAQSGTDIFNEYIEEGRKSELADESITSPKGRVKLPLERKTSGINFFINSVKYE